jgi:redox-sensitive bicupin YhaK (pirin superfamily)
MTDIRPIKRIIKGESAMDGAGVRLTRVFGHRDTRDFDPFLMLDTFDSTDPDDYASGFPWHPHRGIETITYLIEGDIEHGDSLGNKGSIRDGDCQWMTAGSGIIHQEMPKKAARMWGAQLWLNLPKEDKMTAPAYRDIKRENIPIVEENGTTVRIIAGAYGGVKGSFGGNHVKATYLDVEINPGSAWSYETEHSATVFVYILRGSGRFSEGEGMVEEKHAILFGDGDTISVKASDDGVRFLFLAAQPLGEPIAWGGPIVMNTREELDQAFREIESDTFIKEEALIDGFPKKRFFYGP